MKLYLKLPSFHKLKSTTSLSFHRKFHGPPKSEEYTAVAEYPKIPQFKNIHEQSYAELKNQIKSLNTVEEKQLYLNKPKYYGWYSCNMEVNKIPPESLNLLQYVTNTTIVRNQLPEKLSNLDEIAEKEAKRFEINDFTRVSSV